jgi:hypothetical protein
MGLTVAQIAGYFSTDPMTTSCPHTDSENLDALAWNAFADVQLVVSGFAAHERLPNDCLLPIVAESSARDRIDPIAQLRRLVPRQRDCVRLIESWRVILLRVRVVCGSSCGTKIDQLAPGGANLAEPYVASGLTTTGIDFADGVLLFLS